MPSRKLALSKDSLYDLSPAELSSIAAAGTITFVHLECHPTLQLRCSVVIDCWQTS